MERTQSAKHVVCCLLLSLLASCKASELLIKGGTVVNADQAFAADVLVKDGKIQAVAPDLQAPEGARTISAAGEYVLPGGIDPHTHLEFQFMRQMTHEDFVSGQSAALAGGTTMHIDFALPVNGDLAAGFENYKRKSARSVMDYGFHMAITQWNDKVSADMADLVAEGINSFKFFFAYKGALMVTDELYLKGLQRCKELGALAMVHGENGDAIALNQKLTIARGITGPEGHSVSRPSYLEGEATGRAIKLARLVNTPLYVVHVMSKEALEEIEKGHETGQRLFGEAVAGALGLTDEACWDPDFKKAAAAVISPPLRGREHQLALQKGLAGGLLQLVGTDHCGWNSTQKLVGRHDFRVIPNGIHGIEERLHVMWDKLYNSGLMSAPDIVRTFSTEAAKIFNLYPQKGVIQPGSDADLVIFDPSKEHVLSAKTHHSALDISAYEGMKIKGKVVTTISQGKVVYENDKLSVEEGSGRFIKMEPFAPHVYYGLEQRDAAWIAEMFPYGDTPVKRKGDQKPPKEEL
jgi:dihydropyrimidinase